MVSKTYLLIDADGYSGDFVTVWGVYDSLKAGQAANQRKSTQLLETDSSHGKGDQISRGVVRDMVAAGNWKVVAK